MLCSEYFSETSGLKMVAYVRLLEAQNKSIAYEVLKVSRYFKIEYLRFLLLPLCTRNKLRKRIYLHQLSCYNLTHQ